MVKSDCVHFPLDRPCRFHKKTGVKCGPCGKYTPLSSTGKKKILVIKIGAMGDVLRTTFLLEGLKTKYHNPEITWIVAPHSAPMLEKNPKISRVWNFDRGIFDKIAKERFDLCVNLDLGPESLGLATLANAGKKLGFRLDARRRVVCSGPAAEKWLAMSAFDDLKKKNKFTYQYWMSKITGLPKSGYEIYTPLDKASLRRAAAFAKKHGLTGKSVVGINPGAGGRWKFKKWTDSGYLKLIKMLHSLGVNPVRDTQTELSDMSCDNQMNQNISGRAIESSSRQGGAISNGVKVLLLGGPEEKGLIAKLMKSSKGKAINAGTDNSLLDFFALINLCGVVVTGDTMTLHAALGLKKKVVALFGPTSSAEIKMYGRGTKITTPAKCACCYLPDCDVRPDCMKQIKPEEVFRAVKKYINGSPR